MLVWLSCQVSGGMWIELLRSEKPEEKADVEATIESPIALVLCHVQVFQNVVANLGRHAHHKALRGQDLSRESYLMQE